MEYATTQAGKEDETLTVTLIIESVLDWYGHRQRWDEGERAGRSRIQNSNMLDNHVIH